MGKCGYRRDRGNSGYDNLNVYGKNHGHADGYAAHARAYVHTPGEQDGYAHRGACGSLYEWRIFAIIYAVLFTVLALAGGWLWGLIFGAVHGVFAGLVMGMMPMVHPRMGQGKELPSPGLFAKNISPLAPMGLIMLHLVYGAIVGAIYVVPLH
jgi:hypothetical protein